MKTIKLPVLILSTSMIFASLAQAVELKISHVRPQDAIVDQDAKALGAALSEATAGDVTLKIFAASSLGDYTTVQERISIGAVDMAIQPAATASDRRMTISSFPSLAENWNHAKEIYGPGGIIAETMKELYAEQGITMLAVYPVYFGGIALNREAVNAGDPTAAKGIKVRVPGIKSFQMLADKTGYIASPIPFSEAFTAVQTGVVDGVIGSGAEGYYASFRDVTKTYIPANTHFEAWYLIVNTETFEGLDKEDQAAFLKVAEEFSAKRWEKAEKDQSEFEQKLVANGAELVSLSDDELAAIASKVRQDVWPEILEDVGKEWGQAILDKVSAE
ncbi:TRAP transporter substrate-binding protein DctP [Ostreibacterium oceani]|uniref:C4-dicarboxylate ABC transporter n=1 Tax=Ostreibacterium oceani TaxID=2654998 RepID=A0A6N7EU90_9GAMM|nr:TRAP transporter substrate-binding protein DctP [Ostreibacterium oceani]MPV85185.1 C4-dicarboxylate ABC transporter [Ostreibacterium oceani]